MRVASLVCVLSGLCVTASGQGVRRFDMGSATSPIAAGFTAATPAPTYTAAAGFGWTAGTPVAVVQPAIPTQIPAVIPANLLVDDVESHGDLTFAADVPNGFWQGFACVGTVAALAGVHLFNQVTEFGAVSAVSNAGDGEIR